MSFQANVLRVMIASPGDVTEERKIVTEEIHRWNDANALARRLVLLPVKWETHSTPQFGEHPQTIINRQILDEADIVVGIFGTRIGTPTEEYLSGTVEEIKKHVAAGKTAKLYFSEVPVSPSSLDQLQYSSVKQFRQECQRSGLYATFVSVEQFRRDFSHHLDLELNQPRYLWLTVTDVTTQSTTLDLTPDDLRLIRAAASTDDGSIMMQEGSGFIGLRVGDVEFMDGDHRTTAKWRSVVRYLLDNEILEGLGDGLYKLTHAGYAIADKAHEEEEASKPTEVRLNVSGPPDSQYLDIKSNRDLHLSQLDFLTSSDACICSQPLSEKGKEIEAKLAHNKVVELNNSPRADRNPYDHSGPAKLRLHFRVNDQLQEVVLPVMLQPRMVTNTQWITLIGSSSTRIPVSRKGNGT